MNPTEIYKKCVQVANDKTFERFSVRGPYEPGSQEHDYWLSVFDKAYSA